MSKNVKVMLLIIGSSLLALISGTIMQEGWQQMSSVTGSHWMGVSLAFAGCCLGISAIIFTWKEAVRVLDRIAAIMAILFPIACLLFGVQELPAAAYPLGIGNVSVAIWLLVILALLAGGAIAHTIIRKHEEGAEVILGDLHDLEQQEKSGEFADSDDNDVSEMLRWGR